ncbi:conserved hypothetical protein [Anaeromyxobacter sp. K]|uniref:hypothetical protein n=1 Tax=Anaeromyxobacter sp. (strain K) TaxID=447217 RepID=UPI00015F8883|nr:hypothetical protein [Anaeromyxobacter sp. K]ACG73025.1 conserved hypothetical protein [Anaeromyxobacter sp. K]
MRYCEGRPESGARPLTPGERAWAAALRRRLALRAGLAALAGPLALATVPLAPWFARHVMRLGERMAYAAGTGWMGLVLLLGVPAAVLLVRDGLRAWRTLARDLDEGLAVRFGDGAGALELLPRSGRVLPGGARGRARRVAVGEAAAVPADPVTWALPVSDVPEALQGGGWVKRALTPEEKDEIAAFAARVARFPWALAILTLALLAAAAGRAGAHAAAPATAALWVLAAGLGWWRVASARAMAARLRVDVREGWVMRATAGAAAGDEMLPDSRAAWARAGAPAPWRLRRRA